MRVTVPTTIATQEAARALANETPIEIAMDAVAATEEKVLEAAEGLCGLSHRMTQFVIAGTILGGFVVILLIM